MMDLTLVFELLDGTPWELLFALWCVACAVFTAVVPPTITEKIPNFIMAIINVCAFNIGHAKNALTDIKGNRTHGNGKST